MAAKTTFYATTPDGRDVTRSSATRTYSHAVATQSVRYTRSGCSVWDFTLGADTVTLESAEAAKAWIAARDDNQCWLVESWHSTEALAYKQAAVRSPHCKATKVVPVFVGPAVKKALR